MIIPCHGTSPVREFARTIFFPSIVVRLESQQPAEKLIYRVHRQLLSYVDELDVNVFRMILSKMIFG